MTSVHVLPVGSLNPEQVQRLVEELRHAYASGADLGSRLPHIRAAGKTFERLAADLRVAVDRLAADPAADDLIDAQVMATLRRYIENVEQLSALAASMSDPDQEGMPGDPTASQSEPNLAPAGSTATR